MDKELLQSVYDYLNNQHREYYLASNKQKETIESQVRSYSNNIDRELYSILNEGYDSGLFEHGFFESDLSRSIHTLSKLLNL